MPRRCARAATSASFMSSTTMSQDGQVSALTCFTTSSHTAHPALKISIFREFAKFFAPFRTRSRIRRNESGRRPKFRLPVRIQAPTCDATTKYCDPGYRFRISRDETAQQDTKARDLPLKCRCPWRPATSALPSTNPDATTRQSHRDHRHPCAFRSATHAQRAGQRRGLVPERGAPA